MTRKIDFVQVTAGQRARFHLTNTERLPAERCAVHWAQGCRQDRHGPCVAELEWRGEASRVQGHPAGREAAHRGDVCTLRLRGIALGSHLKRSLQAQDRPRPQLAMAVRFEKSGLALGSHSPE